MEKNLFTLIYGDQIRLAPNQKVISATALSTLQTANEVIQQVKKDADHYRLEVAKETEQLKENAFKEGYEAGYQEWAAQLAAFESKLQELQQEYKNKIIPFALTAAKKIVGREIELSKDIIADIIIANLQSVKQHKKITIFVNKRDLIILEEHKPRIKNIFEHLESLSIRPREDIAEGGCVIETELGIINAQLPHRWQVLEKAFENLNKTASEPIKES